MFSPTLTLGSKYFKILFIKCVAIIKSTPKTIIQACIRGISPAWIAFVKRKPIPGQENISSTRIEPVSIDTKVKENPLKIGIQAPFKR